MKRTLLCLMLTAALTLALAACGGDDELAPASDPAPAAQTQTADTTEAKNPDIRFVDGFYANNGNGSDFMIAFYESDAGDVAYVNDGTNEVFAEYTVESAQLDDGTEYLLVTVGATQIGYIESESDIYLVDDEGNIYGAARLTEEEADAIAAAVSQ